MTTPERSPLGRAVAYPGHIDTAVLFAIPRAAQRPALGLGDVLPFVGEDIWTGYELSWLDPKGKPRVAIATLRVPADSPSIIESKSLKLYLNGFAQTRLSDADAVTSRIVDDLSACSGASVDVELWDGAAMDAFPQGWLSGESIDDIDIELPSVDEPQPQLLTSADDSDRDDAARDGRGFGSIRIDGPTVRAEDDDVEETLVTRLFRSNCPVTGQPDWADVQIRYRGRPIDRAALLAYLVSYRNHRGFHEQCVERIFVDIKSRCAPSVLTVYARFTRRGGLDINPWRSDDPSFAAPENARTARQ